MWWFLTHRFGLLQNTLKMQTLLFHHYWISNQNCFSYPHFKILNEIMMKQHYNFMFVFYISKALKVIMKLITCFNNIHCLTKRERNNQKDNEIKLLLHKWDIIKTVPVLINNNSDNCLPSSWQYQVSAPIIIWPANRNLSIENRKKKPTLAYQPETCADSMTKNHLINNFEVSNYKREIKLYRYGKNSRKNKNNTV